MSEGPVRPEMAEGFPGRARRWGRLPGQPRFAPGSLDLQWRPSRWSMEVRLRPWRSLLMAESDFGDEALWSLFVLVFRARSLGWPVIGLADDRGRHVLEGATKDDAGLPWVAWGSASSPAFEEPGLLEQGIDKRALCVVFPQPWEQPSDPRSSHGRLGPMPARIEAMARAVAGASRAVLCVLALARVDMDCEAAIERLAAACGACPHGSRFVLASAQNFIPCEGDTLFGRAAWFDTAVFLRLALPPWNHGGAKAWPTTPPLAWIPHGRGWSLRWLTRKCRAARSTTPLRRRGGGRHRRRNGSTPAPKAPSA